jgi:acyl-CoA thioesterase
VEAQARAIDACDDVAELKRIAKTLLTAWHMQSDMTRYYGGQVMGMIPPKV